MLSEKLKRYGGFGTHDALKLAALLCMVIDHIGVFAFPQDISWRIVGRAAAPVFFFLIGYSRSYRFHLDILLAAILVIAVKFYGTHSLANPDILVGFIIARLLLEQVEKGRLPMKDPRLAFVVLTVLWPISWNLFEYGTLGFLFSLCGYLQRHANRYSRNHRIWMLGLSFVFYEFTTFAATITHPKMAGVIFLTIVLAATGVMLWNYRPKLLPLSPPWRRFESVLAWPARYSLWIYAFHLALLHLITGNYF